MHTTIRACFLCFFYNPYMSLFNSKNFFIYLYNIEFLVTRDIGALHKRMYRKCTGSGDPQRAPAHGRVYVYYRLAEHIRMAPSLSARNIRMTFDLQFLCGSKVIRISIARAPGNDGAFQGVPHILSRKPGNRVRPVLQFGSR